MIRRDRHGWRVLIVLSRLAVAGVLTVSGPPGLTRPQRGFAQTAPAKNPHPPPPPGKTTSRTHSPPGVHPERPPGQRTNDSDAAQPTPADRFTPEADSTPQVALPIPPSLELLTARRNSLNQFLQRDRRHRLLLTRGDRALSQGDVNLALLHFQALIDATPDAFYWPEDSLSPNGAQITAQTRLQSLSQNAREAYQRLHGPEARALLDEAITQGNNGLLLEVLQRFRLTDAGREAIIRELLFANDCGQILRASQLARMLVEDPYHKRNLTSQLQRLIDRLTDSSIQKSSALAAKVADSRPISPPALRPRWNRSFRVELPDSRADDHSGPVEGLDRIVEDAVSRWRHEHEDRQLPITTANQATVVDDLLLVRDFTGVRALDLDTGQLVWSYRCAGSLATAAQESFDEEARGGGSPPLSFHTHFAGQGLYGSLSTDSRRVFLIDSHKRRESSDPNATETNQPCDSNRIVALKLVLPQQSDVASDLRTPQTAWVCGSAGSGEGDPLAGHFFLGPPLSVDGRLYALSEYDGRLHCSALSAPTGEVLWQQPIALVEQPIDWDTVRQRIPCSPLSVGPVIVCPTEVGVVVGVDSLTGSLRWIYDHIDDDQRHAAGRWSSNSQRSFGNPEFPSRMLARKGQVYYLPFRSNFVHRIDATTGKGVKTERRNAWGISAITSRQIILGGPREVTALSTADLSLLWKTACPQPAGQGVIAGGDYLLPIAGGRCLSLSLSDGTITGSQFGRLLHELARSPVESPSTESRDIQLVRFDNTDSPDTPSIGNAGGNLLAAGDVLVMTTPTSVRVFPQARPLLQTLTAETGEGDLSPQQRLDAAMLHLLLGEKSAAKQKLHAVLEGPASSQVQHTANRLHREILFQELASAADPRPILDQLAAMPADDPDHLRLLISRIDAELKLGHPQRLIDAIDQLCHANLQTHVNPQREADYRVQASAYVADRLVRARSQANADVRGALEDYVVRISAEVAASGDIGNREILLSLFGDWPQIADLRNDVAAAALEAGHLQQAELLLLKNRRSPNREAAAHARRLLTDLYTTHGFHREAADNLTELATDYRHDLVGNGLTGQEFVDQFPHDDLAWQVVRRRLSTPLPAADVRITEHVCDEPCADGGCRAAAALNQHDCIRRKFLVGGEASLTVIDRGSVPGERNQSQLTLVNRETGGLHSEFNLPAAYWQLAGGSKRHCGQFLPTCGRTAHGLSLLEERAIWSSEESEATHTRDKVKLGPLGPDFCVLQTPRKLSVIDPGTGGMIWQRSNLPPDVGLLTNESTGIIGDVDTLTLFGEDQKSYTVYRMRSGGLVRHGQLDLSSDDARGYRRAVGSKLVHVVSGDSQEWLQVWDAAADRILREEPLRERLFCPLGEGSQFALITSEGRLLIVDVTTGQVDLDLPLAEQHLQDVTDLAVASDRDHYFVNLVGCSHDSAGETIAATDEVEVPHMRVQGELLAISKAGHILWQQPVPDSVLLTNPECAMPVLILASRVRDVQSHRASRLRIDVLDARSGETLARCGDLLRTRIVQCTYRHHLGQLSLVGLNSQIDIDFGPRSREFLINADVDETSESLVR